MLDDPPPRLRLPRLRLPPRRRYDGFMLAYNHVSDSLNTIYKVRPSGGSLEGRRGGGGEGEAEFIYRRVHETKQVRGRQT